MKRFFYMAIAATLLGGSLAFTSCCSEEPIADEKSKEESMMVSHIQNDAEVLADNLNFDMLDIVNQVNAQALTCVGKGRNFSINMKKILAMMAVNNALKHIKKVSANSDLARMGYASYINLDIMSFGVRVVFSERGDYDVSPAEGLEFLFPATVEGVGKTVCKISLKNSGEWRESVTPSNFGNIKGLACVTRTPTAMTMTLSGLFNNKEVTLLSETMNFNEDNSVSGMLTTALKGAEYGLPDDDSQLDFNFGMSEEDENKSEISFAFTQKSLNVLDFDTQITPPAGDNIIDKIADTMFNPSAVSSNDMLQVLADIFTESQADFNFSILDDLTVKGNINNSTDFFNALQENDADKFNQTTTMQMSYKDASTSYPLKMVAAQQNDETILLPAIKFADKPDYITIRDLLSDDTRKKMEKIYETTTAVVGTAASLNMRLLSTIVLLMPADSSEWGF